MDERILWSNVVFAEGLAALITRKMSLSRADPGIYRLHFNCRMSFSWNLARARTALISVALSTIIRDDNPLAFL